jgi:hypothetical protein
MSSLELSSMHNRTFSIESLESVLLSEPNSPLLSIKRGLRSFSTLSTNASEEGFSSPTRHSAIEEEHPLSQIHSIFSALPDSEIKRSALDDEEYTFFTSDEPQRTSTEEGNFGEIKDELESKGTANPRVKVPLGLRRVMSSMLPGRKVFIDADAQELQAAIGSVALRLDATKDLRQANDRAGRPKMRASKLQAQVGRAKARSGTRPTHQRACMQAQGAPVFKSSSQYVAAAPRPPHSLEVPQPLGLLCRSSG